MIRLTTSNPLTCFRHFRQGMRVHASKVSEQNGGLLPTGYELWGTLIEEPALHQPIQIARTTRSRQSADEPAIVECPGIYTSSPVQRFIVQDDGALVAVTMNSHWRLAAVEPDAPACYVQH
jgi:hypothetical protein